MQDIDLSEVIGSGILTQEVLAQSPGYRPDAPDGAKGPAVVVECVQAIPCNPCETVCPGGAITVGDPITSLPAVDPDRCTGCGICVAACPGLAIFLVDRHFADGRAAVTFAHEYLPAPAKGDGVAAVDRAGRAVCDAVVEKVVSVKNYDMTKVVTISIPVEFADTVRGIGRRRGA